ncbi:MAG: nucleotide pyrophosphohydrolase [Candidatus Lokiarchaeota archaeon]|nr:nucleotide pyrophosphohydrolase [Candidatus Lokiarchaeota archaeon]MBD3198877.1 nucleotide pyrophosphohydrolase [Candidatus Lokiarchaeota archaeon]
MDSVNDFQEYVDLWIKDHGGYWPPLSMLSAIIEEIGELAKEINHKEGYKPKKHDKDQGNIGEELADVLFALICIANNYQIDLQAEFVKVLNKYKKRDAKRFIK